MTPHKTPPSKAEIADLEPFCGLGLENILLVASAPQAGQAMAELMRTGVVGFDTESKPTFHKGEKSEGPHVLQFSTPERAFIFQSHIIETHPVIIELLRSSALLKIGFGLGGDLQQIGNRFSIRPAAIMDLDRSFKQLGYRNAVGAKSAIAILLKRKFTKSKSVTTSNWSARNLTERQLLYAANDAYAAITSFYALQAQADPASPEP
jgi:ribonuclease D